MGMITSQVDVILYRPLYILLFILMRNLVWKMLVQW